VTHECRIAARNDRAASGDAANRHAAPIVEILHFDGCRNHEGARALVERVSREIGVEPEPHLVDDPDEQTVWQLRFLGSPTIRAAGVDVEPQATQRDNYAILPCLAGPFRLPCSLDHRPHLRRAHTRDRGVLHRTVQVVWFESFDPQLARWTVVNARLRRQQLYRLAIWPRISPFGFFAVWTLT